tara:strand:+ start:490 stop:1116 length:627 start_codon:yes stop_codon:yes gene_type:complete
MAMINLVSPVGIARWPRVQEPDYRFHEQGEYNIILQLTKGWDEGEEYIAKLNKICNDWQERCSADLGGELGEFTSPIRTSKDNPDIWDVHMKMTAKGTEKSTGREWEQRPMILNAKKPDQEFTDLLGTGSHIRIAASPYCWFNKAKGKRAGVKLQPKSVFVYKCVSPELRQSAAEMLGLTGTETSYVCGGESYDLADDVAAPVTDQDF